MTCPEESGRREKNQSSTDNWFVRDVMKELIFAGGSHYGLAGYLSVCNFFDRVYLIKDNPIEILEKKRSQDVLIDGFMEIDCKTVFLCGYSRLITNKELEKKDFINVHGALLPKYRGMHATFYAIMNGEEKMGITFHIVDRYMDSGPILKQYCFDYENQTIQEINDNIDALVFQFAGEVLDSYCSGLITPCPQNEDDALFGARRNLDDCLVDFTMNNLMIKRFFRALTPNYPYPMLMIRGEKYELLPDVKVIERKYYGPLGRVVFINEDGVWIKTSEGFIVVKKVRKYGAEKEELLENIVPIGFRFT